MNGRIFRAISRSLASVTVMTALIACGSDDIVATENDTEVDLGSCTNLTAPAGTKLVSHVYASGVQIYRWDETSWVFVAPSAVLTADPAGTNSVGIHFAGPTWQGVSGSKVVGTLIDRCTPNANAIPWISLGAVASDGPGVFRGATFIQRLNTVGGTAPTTPGLIIGEVKSVPYTAEYFFYGPQ